MSSLYSFLENNSATHDVSLGHVVALSSNLASTFTPGSSLSEKMSSSPSPLTSMLDFDATMVESSTKEQGKITNSEYGFAELLWMFMGPVIFLVGLCGNTMILIVMTRPRMRGTSTCVYLTLMAVADSMVLITGMIPEWLEACRIVFFKEIHPVTCKLEKFLFYTSGDTAVWILVIFTVDRFIAVCFPLQKSKFCLSSRARIYSLSALLGSACKNLHVFWTRGYEEFGIQNKTGIPVLRYTNCGRPTEEYWYFEQYVRPWIAFSLINGLPFVIILLCNTFIIRSLISVRRMCSVHAIVSTNDKSLIQMTCMCLSASFCFLIFVTPSIILLIGRPAWGSGSSKRAYDLAKSINNQLFYVNHSVNFFLYCLTGRRFRQVIVSLVKKKKKTRYSGDSFLSDSESKTVMYRTSSPEGTNRITAARYSCAGIETYGAGKHTTDSSGEKKSLSSGNGHHRKIVVVSKKTNGRFLKAPEARL